jgi:5-dehydro-2-deoxygluconokinase
VARAAGRGAGSAALKFETGENIAAALRAWPAEHVAKCLSLSPLDDLPQLRALHDACLATGRELLVELVTQDPPLEALYAAGIRPDWWKLLPPTSEAEWRRVERAIEKHDPYCRGVLLLGMEASEEELERGFALAARHPICKGFAVGRSIFMDAARLWFAGGITDQDVISRVQKNYSSLVATWRKARQACNESVS